LRKGVLKADEGFYCDCGSAHTDTCQAIKEVAAPKPKAIEGAKDYPADSKLTAEQCSFITLGGSDNAYTFFPKGWRVDTPNDMIVTLDVVSHADNVNFLFMDSRLPRSAKPEQAVEVSSVCFIISCKCFQFFFSP
jgi:hypothetical protein